MDKEQSQNSIISNPIITTKSFEDNSLFLNLSDNGEKVALRALKSVDNIIVSTFAKFISLTNSIVFKEIVLISYNTMTKKDNTFALNIPEVKVSSKNFNISRIMHLSMVKISNSQYLILIILSNLIYLIQLEEDPNTNELTHKTIYKDKKMNTRYLISGVESYVNKEVFSLISKPNNQLITLICSLNDSKGEISVQLNQRQLDKSKYQYDRFTQSTCNWILFTEKTANCNIILDKNTLKIYQLECTHDLLSHSFFLMNNDNQLHLITDIEENKRISVYLYKLVLDNTESKFNSELVKVYDVPSPNGDYEKYVFNALNDRCFIVNFFDSFVIYFYNFNTKSFSLSYQLSAQDYFSCQVFNFNCHNDNKDNTHIGLETYKDKQLTLLDYSFNERLIENKCKRINAINKETSNQEDKNDNIIKEWNDYSDLNSNIALKEEVQREEPISGSNKEETNKDIDKTREISKQINQIEQRVDSIIESQIDLISDKIVTKYKTILNNLEVQTKQLEQKQKQFEKCLEGMMKHIKLKEDQTNNEQHNDMNVNSSYSNNKQIRIHANDQLENVINQNNSIINCQSKSDPLLVPEQKGTQKDNNIPFNINSQFDPKQGQIPSFIPKNFQGQNIKPPVNPQVVGLMMNLMGPINQMYSTILNTVLQNQRNSPKMEHQFHYNQNQSQSQSYVSPSPTNPVTRNIDNNINIHSPSIHTNEPRQQAEENLKPFNQESKDNTKVQSNEDNINKHHSKHSQKNKNNTKNKEEGFKEVTKQKKNQKKKAMKNYNDFQSSNPYESLNDKTETNDIDFDFID